MTNAYTRFAPLAPPRARQARPEDAVVARIVASSPQGSRFERFVDRHTKGAPAWEVVAKHESALQRIGLPGLTPWLISTDAHATIAVWLGLGLVAGTLLGGVAVAALSSHNHDPSPPKDHTP